MKVRDYTDLADMCHRLADTSSEHIRSSLAMPATIATSAAVLITALMGVIDTLEEIRDAIKEK